jgi:hypothetical protein
MLGGDEGNGAAEPIKGGSGFAFSTSIWRAWIPGLGSRTRGDADATVDASAMPNCCGGREGSSAEPGGEDGRMGAPFGAMTGDWCSLWPLFCPVSVLASVWAVFIAALYSPGNGISSGPVPFAPAESESLYALRCRFVGPCSSTASDVSASLLLPVV